MKKSIWENALYLGGSLIAIYLLLYFINPELIFNTGISFAMSIIVPIIFIARAIKAERSVNEGTITFGEAFAVAFPVFAIGFGLFFLMNVLHLNLDPDFKAIGERVSMESAMAMVEKMSGFMDTNEEAFDKAKSDLLANPPKITNGLMFFGFIINLVFPGAILALIQAAVMKKS